MITTCCKAFRQILLRAIGFYSNDTITQSIAAPHLLPPCSERGFSQLTTRGECTHCDLCFSSHVDTSVSNLSSVLEIRIVSFRF